MSSLKDPRPGPGRRGHRRGGPVRSRAWELEIFTSLVVGEGARERHWDGGGEGPVPCPWWEGQTASLPEGLLCAGQGSCFPLHFGISPSERGSGSAAGGGGHRPGSGVPMSGGLDGPSDGLPLLSSEPAHRGGPYICRRGKVPGLWRLLYQASAPPTTRMQRTARTTMTDI